jgi:hypothetical protein
MTGIIKSGLTYQERHNMFVGILERAPGLILPLESSDFKKNPLASIALAICQESGNDLVGARNQVYKSTERYLRKHKDEIRLAKPDKFYDNVVFVWLDHFLNKSVLYGPDELRAMRGKVIKESKSSEVRALDEKAIDEAIFVQKLLNMLKREQM